MQLTKLWVILAFQFCVCFKSCLGLFNKVLCYPLTLLCKCWLFLKPKFSSIGLNLSDRKQLCSLVCLMCAVWWIAMYFYQTVHPKLTKTHTLLPIGPMFSSFVHREPVHHRNRYQTTGVAHRFNTVYILKHKRNLTLLCFPLICKVQTPSTNQLYMINYIVLNSLAGHLVI